MHKELDKDVGSTWQDVKQLMRDHYITYASYVILDRAIPDVADGLKPVQRRILHTLYQMHDGKQHKVANIVGQTMALHPHGDAPIYEALVNLANKGYVMDCQGNFGNLYTGDPAAAARYIETRLSLLAIEALFNPKLTQYVPSYDGRNQEPVILPAKIPLLLIQGAEGIAVGMATKIPPHNFVELLQAEIEVLKGGIIQIMPDFLTGGIMDASEYNKGKGKLRLRAQIQVKDQKTIVITEICHGTTTESLIHSIDEAAKKGKIKIDSINDYTSDKVEIEIKLPRSVYAKDVIDALYLYTECEVVIYPQIVVIKEGMPWDTDVEQILRYHVGLLIDWLQQELNIARKECFEKIFHKSLEQIFIEHRLYKQLENVSTQEAVHETIAQSLKPYHDQLLREPTDEDRERLLSIPIRRISRFDLNKNEQEIKELKKEIKELEHHLKHLTPYAIDYLEKLIEKYGAVHPRKTQIAEFHELDRRAIECKQIEVGFDLESGFVGTKVSGAKTFVCTNFDKVVLMYASGLYKVISLPEKQYVHKEGDRLVHIGPADKKTIFNVSYRDIKSKICYAKRFIVKQWILDKSYQYFDEGMQLEFLSIVPTVKLELKLVPKLRQKVSCIEFDFGKVMVKGVNSKGVRMCSREVRKMSILTPSS